ncbi:MAG: aminoglycoside phosphotransferase family protein [Thermomicrobiales bacterium]
MDGDGTEEMPLAGGSVNRVTRVGETVRRSTGPWAPTVHALLRHLEQAQFMASPRVLGMDDLGREVLTFLPGTAMPWTDWPDVMLDGDGLAQLAATLRTYHEAVRSFVPPPHAVWRNPLARPFAEADLVRHGDFSPFNTIWQGDRLTGVIDWDFAQPGTVLEDLGYLAWYAVPLSDDGRARQYGLGSGFDRTTRLRALATAYVNVTPAEMLHGALVVIRKERDDMLALARQDLEPWASFVREGTPSAFAADLAWIEEHRPTLLGR